MGKEYAPSEHKVVFACVSLDPFYQFRRDFFGAKLFDQFVIVDVAFNVPRSYDEVVCRHSSWLRLRFKKSFSNSLQLSQVFHDIEKKIITSLRDNPKQSPEMLERSTRLSPDQVRRGIEWLKLKDLAIVTESKTSMVSLGQKWN